MRKFIIKTMYYLLVSLICSQMLFSQSSIVLDKLSDCKGVSEVLASLDLPVSSECRQPFNKIESLMMRQFFPDASTCLLRSAPTPGLEKFSCVDIGFEGYREIACFRVVPARMLSDYKDNYDSVYKAKAYKYFDAAAKCNVGNGDVSAAPRDIFPSALVTVAKPSFGFVLGLSSTGSGLTASRAYHGYADLDPDIGEPGQSIEVFDVLKIPEKAMEAFDSVPPVSNTNPNGIGVEIVDSPEINREFWQTFISNSGVRPYVAKFRLFQLLYGGSREIVTADRERDLNSWREGMVALLKEKKFRDLTPSEIAASPFSSVTTMQRFAIDHSVFGRRDLAQQLLPKLTMVVRDHADSCAEVAEILSGKPQAGVKNDYGSMGIALIAVGPCGDANALTRSYNAIVDRVGQYVLEQTKDR